ncbi:dynein regulatory complex protein 9-like [Ischnura elegans]|uniref:dynein regulatory complex protein 9-like n=1 Tax=Ischnura elegans TaxID=197161 RepID=UPI001ED8B127|nr:dynein regulatory complex protein 9-like [Ischnura elegans]
MKPLETPTQFLKLQGTDLLTLNVRKPVTQFVDEIIQELECEKAIRNFVKHWEKASQEQQLMRLANEANSHNEHLKRLAKDLEDEENTNESVTKYLNLACEELSEKIKHWNEQYKRDVGTIESTIADLKASKEIQSKKYHDLEREFNSRQAEMDEFLAIREERRRKEAQEKLEHECAVRLQAWWRGLMVRRCLGQFRRRKKGTASKESAKQKKKGKAKK